MPTPICSKGVCGGFSSSRPQSVRIQTEVNIDFPGGYDGIVCTSTLSPGINVEELDNKRIVEKITEQAYFCQSFVKTRDANAAARE